MMIQKRRFCPYCSHKLSVKTENDIPRDHCPACNTFFYDNPLPVVSIIVEKGRRFLLVKRRFEPRKGMWCLPTGFAEAGESIEEAALRELKEETGIEGRIIDFVSVDSGYSSAYGDLIFITFEAEWTEGYLSAGDDADEVCFFSPEKMPELAFQSNVNALSRYLSEKQEYWSIVDSFRLSMEKGEPRPGGVSFLSDKLVGLIEKNAEVIASRWFQDVITKKTTASYARVDPKASLERIMLVLKQFGTWLSGVGNNNEIRNYYRQLGAQRRAEGFLLSEILSAFSLIRKHIWEFALSQGMWSSTIDIYMSVELEIRMMLFFDLASFHAAKGYEESAAD